MNKIGPEAVASAFSGEGAATTDDYRFLGPSAPTYPFAFLAVNREGCPALVLPLRESNADSVRITRGMALRAVTELAFAGIDRAWRAPAAVFECRDKNLLRTFSAMVVGVAQRWTARPSWEEVARVFAEWERLMAKRTSLKGESEYGLWGELWFLAHTTTPDVLLAGWRGPEGQHVDFLVGEVGLEVKAGRRRGVHTISQLQADEPGGNVRHVLASMLVLPEPISGLTLPAMVRAVSKRVADIGAFEEKLAEVGYSRDDEELYTGKYALMEIPALYLGEDIPRVRAFDPGISQIRYRVELPQHKALDRETRASIDARLGITPSEHPYPCA